MGAVVFNGRRGTLADMNVVPLIDILLVLLVIFMIIAPAESKGLPAQIPQPATGPLAEPVEVVVIEVLDSGAVRINQRDVPWTELQGALARIFADRAERVAFLKGGNAVDFARVAQVIDLMRGAGIVRVGLITSGLERAPGMV